VVARFSFQLFPGTQGGLYTKKASQKMLELVMGWGGPVLGENEFLPNECVALRRGRVYAVSGEDSGSSLTCQHVHKSVVKYICVPLIAYGEIQGVLHIRSVEGKTAPAEEGKNPFGKSKLGVAGTIADYIALALANLKLREALRQQSNHDPVTGLHNRRYMMESLERELRRALREKKPLGILMLDIDNFKKLNDSFGHDAGDAVLKEVGTFLKMQVRGNDVPCRYGGEEFLIILPGIPLDECRKRAEIIREGVKQLNVNCAGKSLPSITLSVGVAEFPNHGDLLDDLLKSADIALYQAKAAGRDRVVVGESKTHPISEEVPTGSPN
jgi:diguanylate cyclase (GGDEF)-like protein